MNRTKNIIQNMRVYMESVKETMFQLYEKEFCEENTKPSSLKLPKYGTFSDKR